MKRILLCSPVRGGVKPVYVRSLISILFADWKGSYSFDWAATSGTSVAMARDELADVAIRRKFDELLFWDIDLGPDNPAVLLAILARLLSHDVPIVGAQYVGHNLRSGFHGAVSEDGAQPRKDGLLPMAQIPIGFCKISVEALLKIRAHHPQHRYMLKQTCDIEAKPEMFEFFPNGVVGPCTGQGKIERLKILLKDYVATAHDSGELLNAVSAVVNDSAYETNIMLGEDFYFCRLAREAGIPIFIDNNVIIPHESAVRLPVPNSTLTNMLMEEWRWGENVMASEVEHLIAGLRSKLGRDHI